MQILYELVTVSKEFKAIYVTEKAGRRPWMKICKSGDLPVYRGEVENFKIHIFHRPRVIGRNPVYKEMPSDKRYGFRR